MELLATVQQLDVKFNGNSLPVAIVATITSGNMAFQIRHRANIEIINLDGLAGAEGSMRREWNSGSSDPIAM